MNVLSESDLFAQEHDGAFVDRDGEIVGSGLIETKFDVDANGRMTYSMSAELTESEHAFLLNNIKPKEGRHA